MPDNKYRIPASGPASLNMGGRPGGWDYIGLSQALGSTKQPFDPALYEAIIELAPEAFEGAGYQPANMEQLSPEDVAILREFLTAQGKSAQNKNLAGYADKLGSRPSAPNQPKWWEGVGGLIQRTQAGRASSNSSFGM